MSKKTIVAAWIAVVAVLWIGNAVSRFPRDGVAMAQHEDHDQHGHGGSGHDDPDDHAAEPGDHDKHGDHDEHGDEHGGHEGHEEGVVHLNAAQLSGLRLTHVEVRHGSLTTMVELPGEISWNADRLVHISPRVRGIVSSVERTLGDRVEVGDVLCVLDSREMGDAKMEYLADLSRFEVARAD
ncbi:MAG: efflux RND transporter periplasmic adaptor subunit, partial [Dehalococcoidia bacterium]